MYKVIFLSSWQYTVYWMWYDLKTLHNAETSVWRFFRYLLQHHVKVLPLYILSELG